MNKIFKVIYSKTRHCYVVVSELAKSHCKSTVCPGKSKTALTAAVLLALGTFSFVGMPTVQAEDPGKVTNDYIGINTTVYDKSGKKENSSLSERDLSNSNYGGVWSENPGAITVGVYAGAGQQTVTIGNNNRTHSVGSVYIGEHKDYLKPGNKPTPAYYVTSVGFNADAAGYGSIAIGSNAQATNSDTNRGLKVYQMSDEKGNGYGYLENNPTLKGASVAVGYSANAADGNVAIGAYSQALMDDEAKKSLKKKSVYTDEEASSYVSVGGIVTTKDTSGNSTTSTIRRRISNVADGADATDVATVGQLQALSKELGGYKAGFGIQIDPDSTDKTKNTISLNRNLGKDYNTNDDVNLKNDADGTSLILGGRVEKGSPTGGQSVTGDYGALGKDSVTVGGVDNTVETTGEAAVVVGGIYNKAAGTTSAVVGGSANDAIGNESAIFGGFNNDATGTYATISGGSHNRTYGDITSVFGGSMNNAVGSTSSVFGGSINTATGTWSSVIGGSHNTALGLSSTAVGGENAIVDGTNSVGVAGGSTNADYALAAGNEATVTVNNGTAIGYQATANKEGTVAFGHDKGDVYYTSTWPQKATEKDGKYYDAKNKKITKDQYEALRNADLTFNDYSQKPTVTENKYGAAAYNRLVKVADGVDDHDVVVMEQLKNAKNDLKVNAGWGINVNDVTTENDGTETTTKNVISLNRNLGTNYGNLGWGEGKVTFEASGQNSLILGGAASVSEYDHHSDVKAGVYGKDSVLVGGFNNLIGEKGETSVIVGGQENQVTNQKSVIVGGFWNKVTGSNSVVVGGKSNEASGSVDGVFGGSRNKVSGRESVVLGGETNEVIGMNSVVSGGTDNKVSGHYASANGGKQNTISGNYAATLGGFNNQSKGMFSNAIGGDNNVTSGQYSMTSGGSGNTASGDNSYIGGGSSNQAAGVGASVFGGYRSKVNGNLSTGVGGGSTNNRATAALAAGYQSMVTDGGVAYRSLTSEEISKIYKGQQYWPGFSGFLVDNDTKVLDRISTAIGYQATADAPGVISFGHDKGDNSSENGMYSSAYYNRLVKAADGIEDHDAVVMEQLKNASDVGSKIKVYQTDENGNIKFDKNNNPIEDTSDSDAVKTKREAAQKASEDAWGEAIGTGKVEANNSQLVTGDTVYNAIQNQAEWKLTTNGESADKAAAIKPGTTVNFSAEKRKDHSNVTISHNGSNVTIGLDKDIVLGDTSHSSGGSLNVYTDSSDGNNLSNHVSINGSTISVNYPKSNDDKKTPTDTRGVVLGVGEEDSKPDGYIAFNNVEGGYTYLHASTDASDDKKGRLEYVGSDGNKKYIANLDDVSTAVNNAKTKYYSVNENEKAPLMNLDKYKNDGNDGAKGMGSLAAGFVTHADGIASTVAGSYSGVIGSGLQGAAAVSVGTVNVNNNTDPNKIFSGVANSIVGQANMTTDSNAAIIYGAGNTVTNSYRFIDPKKAEAILDSVSNPTNLSKAMQDAVKESGGQVMVMGGGNNVESAYMSQVVGVGNTVTGADSTYAEGTSTQYNFVDGFQNELTNGKNDYIIGSNNSVTGDHIDKNQSNIVVGDNHTLTNRKNNVVIGSADKKENKNKELTASDATVIGHNADVTVDGGVAIGSDSVSTATAEADAEGYDPISTATNKASTNPSATWKATTGAVSIGANGTTTRRITNLAAGFNDTDAVNVAQIKELANIDASNIGTNLKGSDSKAAATTNEQNTNENAWGKAIGTGKIADSDASDKETNGSQQLVTGGTVYKALNGGMTKIVIGTPGENGKDGAPGTIGLVGPAGADGKNAEVDITIQQGKDEESKGVKGANGVDGQDGITRIVYKDAAGDHQVATMEDGLKFAGDDGQKDANKVIAKKLNNIVDIIGGAKGDLTEGNIGVNNDSGKLKIQLAQELTGITSISGSTGSNGAKITLDTNDQNISVNGGKITDVASGLSTNDGSYNAKDANNAANISDVNSMISKAVTDAKGETQQNLDKKANVDASNIGTKLKGADGKTAATEDEQKANLDKWGEAIGTGEVKDGSNQLVTGNTVYNAVKDKADKSYVDTQLSTKANTDGSNIDADKFSKKVAIGNINDSDERAVSGKTVNEAIQTINGNIDGKANKNLDNIDNAGKNVIKDQARAAVTIDNKGLNTNVVATQDDKNHTTTYTINVEGNGKVAAKDTGLISGDTIYNELRPATDGTYIKTTNTTAQNLTSLDTQVRATHDLINSDGKTIKIGGSDAATKIDVSGNSTPRVITGVQTDPQDAASAANVGYVNDVTAASTQQIYRDMNRAYGSLNNNINRAAAGSNALAALHPLDFDPADKASFAVGYGHYRNANAAAVGAFYQPNANTMVNMGISLGNGDPGFNAGVSFKIGKGSAYNGVSKAEMAQTIHDQATEISAIKADDAAKDKRIDALEKENQEMKKQIQEILARLNG